MNGKVELSEMWGRLMTLLMWPWPLRMFIRWMLIRWSWLGRYSLIGLIFFYEHYHHQNEYSFWTVAKFPLSQVCQSITHWCWWSSQHRIEFFFAHQVFLPGLVLLAMSSKSSPFPCTEILEQDRDVGIRSTSLNLYFSQVIGIHSCIENKYLQVQRDQL